MLFTRFLFYILANLNLNVHIIKGSHVKRKCKAISFKRTHTSLKAPRKRGNIVAETLLRKHCFLAAQTGKHSLKKQNVSEKKSETFFVSQKLCGDRHLELVARSLEEKRQVKPDVFGNPLDPWASITSCVRYFIEGCGNVMG